MLVEYRKGPKRKALPVYEIEPEQYNLKPVTKRVCTFDTETDPFAENRIVKPFTCGHYEPESGFYIDFWGDDCIDQYFKWLAAERADIELVIYCHNFGNFDGYFLTDYFDAGHKPFIINGRLVRVFAGGQEFRDSYANIPVALGDYQKTAIDYAKLERTVRHLHKTEILAYQRDDCANLAELIVPWLEMFGNKLTMASAALPMLRSFHGFDTLPETLDSELRPYYFGGRNQCFATGLLEGDFKVYDINSSYPNVMREFKHPISGAPRYDNKITERTHFAHIRAWSLGALPVRQPGGSLDFPIGTHDFYACIHEIKAGLETGTLRIVKVYSSMYFDDMSDFSEFVDTFYKLRMDSKAQGDKVLTLFYKLLLNSSYGKFAQDPRKYQDWLFDPDGIPEPQFCEPCFKKERAKEAKEPCERCTIGTHNPYGWSLHTVNNDRNIYVAPQRLRASGFFNVATAASITSAARANLLRGIQAAQRPIYCDTDCVICEALEPSDTITIDPLKLGAWDIEARGDTVCIAGKKLYAIFRDGKEVKKASKGVKLTAEQIRRVSAGEVIEYAHPVPKFSLDGGASFTVRKIKRTA